MSLHAAASSAAVEQLFSIEKDICRSAVGLVILITLKCYRF